MSGAESLDVVVIGSGPAGCVAATRLARAGLRVALIGDAHREGRCDVLVGGAAQRLLAAAGITASPAGARSVDRLDLHFGTGSARRFTEIDALVTDEAQLRAALLTGAAEAGAVVTEGTVRSFAPGAEGYRMRVPGVGDIAARHVVLAVGAHSDLLPGSRTVASSGLACAQRFRGVELSDRVVLVLAPPEPTRADSPATSAWALPSPDGQCTVGAARIGITDVLAPDDLIAQALNVLSETEERFATATQSGPMSSARLDTNFSPARIARGEGLLIGDAAGLVNPFTAEGISYAVESALLAADAIIEHPADAQAARRSYRHRTSSAFVGFFETSRHAARRYHLAWRILEAAAESDAPFFAKGRRAVLLPEGLGGLSDRMHPGGTAAAAIRPYLLACDEVMLATIRNEWPFLARLSAAGEGLTHPSMRPAVLFAAALVTGGRPLDPTTAPLAAAVELTCLGALAFLGDTPPDPESRRGVNWAVAGTVLAGDFLLAQGACIVAETAPDLSWSFADWLAELATLRAARLDPERDTPPSGPYSALFEFPARVGAQLGGASERDIDALRAIGEDCGRIFLHAEEILALRGHRTRLDTTLEAMIRSRNCDIAPSALGIATAATNARRASLDQAVHDCVVAENRTLAVIADLPDGIARRLLMGLAHAIARPAHANFVGT